MSMDKKSRSASQNTHLNDSASERTPGARPRTTGLGAVQRKSSAVPMGAASAQPDTAGFWTGHPMMDAALRGQDPVQAKGGMALDNAEVQSVAHQGVSGSGGALPHMSQIQSSFGDHDVSGIRAHVGGEAAAASDAIGASAYATGHDVAFKSAPDLHTAAHEAAHVIQQQQGVQLAGNVGQEGDAYERHADAVADRVVTNQSADDLLSQTPGHASPGVQRAVQRVPDATLYTTTATSSLSAELQAGLSLAKANPTSVPSPLPDWIETGNRPSGLANADTAGKPYNSKEKKQFQHKWGRTYNNNDGNLPGVAGAGGYNEYYAQPASDASDIFGKNRILRQTNDPDGGTYWWASKDHYNTIAHVTDA